LNLYEEFLSDTSVNDFRIVCSDGVKIHANRIVLAKLSPVFRKMMLRMDMLEKEKKEMIIDDIDSETMREFVNFLYTGKVECTKKLVNSLLYAADKYEVVALKYFCMTYIKKKLSTENVWEVLRMADMYSDERLLIECIGLIYM
jgi:hypothetical protein